MTISKDDMREVLKEYGVITGKSLGKALKEYGVSTKKDLNKVKKELQESIASVAFNSPTYDQFNKLEKRVGGLEAAN